MNTSARRLAPLLAALAMIGPFSIDTFFPAFKAMELHFGVSSAAMQQTISVYLAVYSVMALLHGPLSDAFGRRRVVLAFVALFALASLGCTFAPSFGALLFFRAMQGVAAGAGLIVSRAIIRDRFDGPDAQRLMSQITLIFGVAPALAPVIGGWLLALSNSWRPLFGFLTGFGLLLLAWCAWRLPETLSEERRVPISARTLFTNYSAMLRDPPFCWLSLTAGFNFGALFLYISSAPTFILDVLKLGEQDFAWLFVPAIGGMMIGATVSGRLAGKRTPPEMMRLGYRLIVAGAAVNLAVNLLFPPGVPWSVLPIGLGAIGITIGFPTVTLMVLDRFPLTRGTASSLQTAVSLLMMSALSGFLSPLVSHDALLLAVTAAALSATGYGCWRMARRAVAPESGPMP